MSNTASIQGHADVRGQDIYYELHGEGPTLVLVMGIGYDATLWANQVAAFANEYRVLVFDNRDVGRSGQAATPYGIADMADDLAGLMDALGILRAHVLGLSMGGMIAQEFAIRYPSRLDKLVLTGVAGATARSRFDPIASWRFVKDQDPDGMAFAGQQFHWLFSESFLRNDEAVDQVLQMLGSNPNPMGAEAFARQAAAYLEHDVLDRLEAVTAPTLVIAGERDRLTPPWICEEVADHIPRAQLEVVRGPGASHVLPLERPADFNRLVLDFLGASA